MSENTLFYWKKLPNRDQALDLVYEFLRALSQKDTKHAEELILVKDMQYFQRALHDSLLQYLEMVIEDDDWTDYEGRNLALEIDDPAKLDEDLTMPEFSGKHFDLIKDETVSVQIGLRETVTPIRLHFALAESDELYYLKLQRISAK
jgi:hypothetical protein